MGRLHVEQYLKWIMSPNTFSEIKGADVMGGKAGAHPKPLKVTILAKSLNTNLQEISTEQAHQVLRSPLPLAA